MPASKIHPEKQQFLAHHLPDYYHAHRPDQSPYFYKTVKELYAPLTCIYHTPSSETPEFEERVIVARQVSACPFLRKKRRRPVPFMNSTTRKHATYLLEWVIPRDQTTPPRGPSQTVPVDDDLALVLPVRIVLGDASSDASDNLVVIDRRLVQDGRTLRTGPALLQPNADADKAVAMEAFISAKTLSDKSKLAGKKGLHHRVRLHIVADATLLIRLDAAQRGWASIGEVEVCGDERLLAFLATSREHRGTLDHLGRTGGPSLRDRRTQLPPAWRCPVDVQHALRMLGGSAEGAPDHTFDRRAGARSAGVGRAGARGAGVGRAGARGAGVGRAGARGAGAPCVDIAPMAATDAVALARCSPEIRCRDCGGLGNAHATPVAPFRSLVDSKQRVNPAVFLGVLSLSYAWIRMPQPRISEPGGARCWRRRGDNVFKLTENQIPVRVKRPGIVGGRPCEGARGPLFLHDGGERSPDSTRQDHVSKYKDASGLAQPAAPLPLPFEAVSDRTYNARDGLHFSASSAESLAFFPDASPAEAELDALLLENITRDALDHLAQLLRKKSFLLRLRVRRDVGVAALSRSHKVRCDLQRQIQLAEVDYVVLRNALRQFPDTNGREEFFAYLEEALLCINVQVPSGVQTRWARLVSNYSPSLEITFSVPNEAQKDCQKRKTLPPMLSLDMPASASERCFDAEERQLRRQATYRRYNKSHAEERRASGRERMARLRADQTEAQRERHRECQRRYRERFREQIAHRARRAAERKNASQGKITKRRPKGRQYWSDPELATESEESEDDTW
ncbi:hypothetical protein C8R43DRAFT_963675 [Mycena crocata]|nr:hypothetical protein C8R43DRAFT_963675 [Mycena crocata]